MHFKSLKHGMKKLMTRLNINGENELLWRTPFSIVMYFVQMLCVIFERQVTV